jgi:hypothetical protein
MPPQKDLAIEPIMIMTTIAITGTHRSQRQRHLDTFRSVDPWTASGTTTVPLQGRLAQDRRGEDVRKRTRLSRHAGPFAVLQNRKALELMIGTAWIVGL